MGMEADGGVRKRKWLWGCVGGILGFIAIVTVISVCAWLWFSKSVPVVPPETFVAPDASAFAIVRAEPDDALMAECITRLMAAPDVRRRLDAQGLRSQGPQIILGMAPVQMIIVAQGPREGRRPACGIALSAHKYGRGVFAMVSGVSRPKYVLKCHGVKIKKTDEGVIAVRKNNFMWATGPEIVRAWIERLIRQRQADPAENAAPELDATPEVKAAYQKLNQQAPLLFCCLNENDRLAKLAERLPAQSGAEALAAGSKDIRIISGQIETAGPSAGKLTVWIECAGEEAADTLSPFLRAAAEQALDEADLKGLLIQQDGAALEVQVTINNLPARLATLADNAMKTGNRKAPHPPAE
ncbi:MAG: hypothetical protein J7M08_09700 [Planctomycetes bacterium]|nr:hypothetical protein [Planctomycetota bacterium]